MIMRNISAISIQQIQMFLSVAETGSFTISAKLFNITQPGISKNLSKLEETLDFPLFIRNNKVVELTSIGKELYKEWTQGLDAITQGFIKVKTLHESRTGDLNLGMFFTLNSNKALKPYVNAWKAAFPAQNIHILEENLHSLEEHIDSGKLSIGVIPSAELYSLDPHKMNWRPIAYDNMQVILSSSHPLTKKKNIFMEDITMYPQIIYAPVVTHNANVFIKEQFQPFEHPLNIEGRGKSSYEIHDLIVGTERILLTDCYFHYAFEDDDCVQLPVYDRQGSIYCVWNKNIEYGTVTNFLSLVDKLCPLPSAD